MIDFQNRTIPHVRNINNIYYSTTQIVNTFFLQVYQIACIIYLNVFNSQRFWSWLKEARRVFKECTRRDQQKERDLFYQARFLLIITILEIVLYILLLSNVLIELLLSREQKKKIGKIYFIDQKLCWKSE
eukprot:TRINITY_DN2415_c0_g1_i30.p5 TRINITY_DN2415_c0_g1~~TRINITY_DN2415_c0_g1_i30.p5  ORF type:complete len:130 (-),score=0.81 TRINITY_DN2415_c0_g1_i30:205-594(-)